MRADTFADLMSSPCLVSKGVCWFQTGGEFPVWQRQSLRQCRGQKEIWPGVWEISQVRICSEGVLTQLFLFFAKRSGVFSPLSFSLRELQQQLSAQQRLITIISISTSSLLEVSLFPRPEVQSFGRHSTAALTVTAHNTKSDHIATTVKPQYPIRLLVLRRLTVHSFWTSLQGQRK